MISLLRRSANRRNARRSTGPRTASGKARAAQNARKHGLRAAALRDPAMTKNIAELARKLAGPGADAQRFEAACRLVAAQMDLQHIRMARVPLLARALKDRTAVGGLATLDIYERDARSRRKSAARKFGSVRPRGCAAGNQKASADTGSAEVDLTAVLRRLSEPQTAGAMLRHPPTRGRVRRSAVYLRFGQRPTATVLGFSANEARKPNKNNGPS
jgi:hypothetical protein